MGYELLIILVASLTALACAIPGIFLILRGIAMMSDALSHSVLLGIVLMLFIVGDLSSPYLLVGAGLTGIFLVFLIELLGKTKRLPSDAAMALVFPALFSIAVFLINKYLHNVHIDTHMVLSGEILYISPKDSLILFGYNLGPKPFYTMLIILLINISFIGVFFKELKISTFDKQLASTIGSHPMLMHYFLMAVVAITAVGSFKFVGSILVTGLMIAPAATAYLLTDNLFKMLIIASIVGVVSAVSGFYLADFINSSPTGSMAMMTGVSFLIAYIFAPKRGLIAKFIGQSHQKDALARKILLTHLLHGEDDQSSKKEVLSSIQWKERFVDKILNGLIEENLVKSESNHIVLTDRGKKLLNELRSLSPITM